MEPQIIEPKKEHLSTIIFLHGLDQNAPWKEIFEKFIKRFFSNTKFIFPRGSSKKIEVEGLEISSPTDAWYSMSGNLNKIQEEIPLEEIDKWIKINRYELLKSRDEINKIISQEINLGILPQNIVIVGISQGGSVTLAIWLVSEYTLGGIICMSGFFPFRQEELIKSNNIKTPILICHGKEDSIVPYWIVKKTTKILGIETKSYPYGHELGPKVFKDAINFSKRAFLEKEINFDDKEILNNVKLQEDK